MSTNQTPKDGEGTGSESLWQILHDPGQTDPNLTPQREDQSAAKPAETPQPAPARPPLAPPSTTPSQPAEDDASGSAILQRILTAPEDLGPEFEYRPAGAVDEKVDFDKALLNYYRDTGITVTCRNHPEQSATGGQCPVCTAYFCQECMVVRKGRFMCRDCAEAMYVPNPEDVLAAQERGLEAPETDVLPESFPEFQVGNEMFGREGTPASPVKQIIALALDFAILRSIELAVLFILSLFFSSYPAPVFHLFSPEGEGTASQRIIEAVFLLRPAVPWLIFFAIFDYIYFFLCLTLANRTVGMSWTGCRLVTEWGDFVGASAVALRTMVFMVCLGIPAILIGWFFPAFRGPHDYAAGTLVINYAGVKRVDVYENVQIKL
jgi:uncharacterized RDD family membrane protein YckC